MEYVCTINEANMGLQIAAVVRDIMMQMGMNLQIGMNFDLPKEIKKRRGAEAIGHVIRHVYKTLEKPILVTENGIGTDDDTQCRQKGQILCFWRQSI